jgi:hypothetical protein
MPANFEPDLPNKVPSNTVLMVDGADLGANGALDALGLLLVQSIVGADPRATPPAGVTPEEYESQMFDQAAQLLGFNLQTAFIDQLVGEFGLAIWGVETLDPASIGGVFVSDVGDADQVNSAVSQISLLAQAQGQGEFSITTRQIGTDSVNVLDLTQTGTPVTVEYGVVGSQFLLGVNDALNSYTGTVSDPLSANPSYQAALATLPQEHNSVFYLDLGQLIPLAEMLQGTSGIGASEDASEKCGEYATQADAQAALDEDPGTNWELDSDFDGEACEDYFAVAGATPVTGSFEPDLSKIGAFASVGYQQDGMVGTSSILIINQ